MVQLNLTMSGEIHPLTEGITARFSTNALPFTLTTWSCVVVLFLVFLAHEVYAAYFRPLLSREINRDHQGPLQSALLFYWFCWYLNDSMLLPVSLDFAESMGESAAMSGFFGSCSLLASVAGVMFGKVLVSETRWNQRWARRVVIWSPLISMVFTLAEAQVSNMHVHGDVESKRQAFWFMILLIQFSAFAQSLPYVPLMVMWSKVTPNRQKSFWMMATQCFRQGGFLVGPGVLAIVSKLTRGSQTIAPASLMAWVLMAQCAMGFCATLVNAMVLPTELRAAEEDDCEVDEPMELCVDSLDRGQREEVVQGMVWFAFERQFIVASIEASTIMLLELSYNWPSELTGSAFTVVGSCSLGVSSVSTLFVSKKLVLESKLFIFCNCLGLLGAICLFDFGMGPTGLMMADALIVCCAAVSNGIAEGWGSRAAVAGTSFSNEAYRTSNTTLGRVARFLAPMLTRSLLDLGGRNVYASVQLVMAAISTATVYKSVSMVWDMQREKMQTPLQAKRD